MLGIQISNLKFSYASGSGFSMFIPKLEIEASVPPVVTHLCILCFMATVAVAAPVLQTAQAAQMAEMTGLVGVVIIQTRDSLIVVVAEDHGEMVAVPAHFLPK